MPQSEPADPGFQSLLQQIVRDPVLEWEWLDLLSQLEYIGCRKILKAVPYERVDREVLRHIAEEASHAFLLKSLVPRADWTGARFAAVGWKYFQAIDRRVSALQDEPGGCYPAVSWAVEQRVLRVYPAYAHQTLNAEVKRVLGAILAQEKRHHDVFAPRAGGAVSRATVLEIEERCWSEFKTELRALLHETDVGRFPRIECSGARADR